MACLRLFQISNQLYHAKKPLLKFFNHIKSIIEFFFLFLIQENTYIHNKHWLLFLFYRNPAFGFLTLCFFLFPFAHWSLVSVIIPYAIFRSACHTFLIFTYNLFFSLLFHSFFTIILLIFSVILFIFVFMWPWISSSLRFFFTMIQFSFEIYSTNHLWRDEQ